MENNCLEPGGVVWEEGEGEHMRSDPQEAGKPIPACWTWRAPMGTRTPSQFLPSQVPLWGSSPGDTQAPNTFERRAQNPPAH